MKLNRLLTSHISIYKNHNEAVFIHYVFKIFLVLRYWFTKIFPWDDGRLDLILYARKFHSFPRNFQEIWNIYYALHSIEHCLQHLFILSSFPRIIFIKQYEIKPKSFCLYILFVLFYLLSVWIFNGERVQYFKCQVMLRFKKDQWFK